MNAIFEAFGRASLFGLAALAVALLAQWALSKRVPAAWRAWIWRIALLQSAFALLPLAPLRWEVLAPPAVATMATLRPSEPLAIEDLPPLEIPEMPDTPPITNVPPAESAPPVAIAAAKTPPTPFDWRALMLAVYTLGVAFQCTQLVRGARQLHRVLRDCAPAESANLIARLSALAARLNLKSAPRLLISEGKSPFLTGIWRPQIVLPRALCEVESAQLDAILAHELAHAKRRDLAWFSFMWLLQTLLWFHPLSWAARRFHGLETECACDELALQLAPIAPQSYGALLLNSMNNSKFSSPLAAGTCDTLFALKTRLLRLNHAPTKPRRLAKLAFVVALVLSCGALVPLKLVARAGDAPQLPEVVGSAVAQGVITSKQTGKPLASVSVISIPVIPKKISSKEIFTVDGDGEFSRNFLEGMLPDLQARQETVTDARGYFRLNAVTNNYILLVDGEISFSGSKYIEFSARHAVMTEMEEGQRPDYEFALDEASQRTQKFVLKTPVGNAVVQGVVTSKQTGQPLTGVPVILISDTITQRFMTDARGYFRFNAPKGKYYLGANQISPARTFDLAGEQKRDFILELDETFKSTGKAVVQGVVTSPQSPKPIAGAFVVSVSGKELQQSVTDARGSFRFKVDGGKQMLSATTGETNPRERSKGYIFFDLEDGKTRSINFDWNKTSKITRAKKLAPKVVGNAVVQGVVTSKQTRKPLAGVIVTLTGNRSGSKNQEVLTDNRGYFRFNAAGGKYALAVGFIGPIAPKIPVFRAQSFAILDVKSGKKYDFKFDVDETIKTDANRIPTKLPATRGTGDAVVQGVIVSKQSQKPLAGVPIVIMAGNARMTPKTQALAEVSTPQKAVTDGRGYFRFNVAGGVHSLLIDGKISVDAGKISDFAAQQIYVIPLGSTEMRNFRFKLDEGAFRAPKQATTGTVLGPDGQPFAGATVQVSILREAGSYSLTPVTCDGNGRFQLSVPESGSTLQLWADAGELTTPQSTFVAAGGDAKLRLQKNAWLSVSGRTVDETKQSLAGATVHLYTTIGNLTNTKQSVKSDAQGSFRFDRVRPGSKLFVTSSLKGYGSTSSRMSKSGNDTFFTLTMPRATATLRGVVIGEDGQPARNFQVQPFGSIPGSRTDAKGRFLLPQIQLTATRVRVFTPTASNGWGPFDVRGGDQNVKIRLTKSVSDARFPRIINRKPNPKHQALIGKIAPPIQASYWANNNVVPISSLRGKVVLLVFNGLNYNPNRAIADFARSFAGRVQVIAILPDLKSRTQTKAQVDATAKEYAFPIALDSPKQNRLGRPTLASYGDASYAVIGRDGVIAYAGNNLNSALKIASS